jgi:hypothetical protein
VLTIEQPFAAQRFSAQESLEALRPVNNETILPSAQGCSKVSTSGRELSRDPAEDRV